MGKQVTALDIKEALANYHSKDFFITECKNGSTYFPPSQGLLKFDGLAIKKSYTKPCITGYEIKVSRSDFLQDNKWHLYLQYCNEFYFVVPVGLISKEELPDNVGLIYFYPDNKTLRKKKKALWRDIEEPIGVYKYIVFSRLDQDRLPFYEERAEFAKDYLEDKAYKKNLGGMFGSRLAKDLQEANYKLEKFEYVDKKIQLLEKIQNTMRKHDIGWYTLNEERILKELDEALESFYPKEMEDIVNTLKRTINKIDAMKEKYSTFKNLEITGRRKESENL